MPEHQSFILIVSRLDFILKELKFDSGFNYKKEKPLEALQRLAPQGIDIYYENVKCSSSSHF